MMYQIFGNSPAIKMLDWMIENQEYDHSMKEIAAGAELAIAVARKNLEPALRNRVVKVNRVIGRDEMYVLDLQNRCTKAIIEFDKQIAKCCESQPIDEGGIGENESDDQEQSPILILPPEM